jgi:hypothetical protein
MAAGWPTKVTYANGDVFSASDINDTNGTLNYIDPTSATDGQVLTRDNAAPGKVKWAGVNGMTVLSSGSLASGGTSLTSIVQTYNDLVLVLRNFFPSGAGSGVRVRLNNDTGSNYASTRIRTSSTTTYNETAGNAYYLDDFAGGPATSNQGQEAVFSLLDYTNTTTRKLVNFSFFYQTSGSADVNCGVFGAYKSNSAITQIDIAANAGNLSGTYILYGVK